MKKFKLTAPLWFSASLLSAITSAENGLCPKQVAGYRVVPNSVFEFMVDGSKNCFFAFYTKNDHRELDVHGDGNPGEAIWYAYINPAKATKEFSKLAFAGDPSLWQDVCDMEAVSFIDINNDQQRDVSVIGACLKSTHLYRRYFVFLRKGNDFVVDEDVFYGLLGRNDLDMAGLKKYIAEQAKAQSSPKE